MHMHAEPGGVDYEFTPVFNFQLVERASSDLLITFLEDNIALEGSEQLILNVNFGGPIGSGIPGPNVFFRDRGLITIVDNSGIIIIIMILPIMTICDDEAV